MAENTKIEWCDHSASPWHGCAEVHAGCDNYARTMAKRNPGTLGAWGKDGTRVMSASFAKNCRRWNADAKKRGVIETVFPSICDPFEGWEGDIFDSQGNRLWIERSGEGGYVREIPTCSFRGMRPVTMDDLRRDLFALIDECQSLRFLLLTKRPDNVRRMWPVHSACEYHGTDPVRKAEYEGRVNAYFRENVAIITSMSDQATADAMLQHIPECRELVQCLGVSAEPLLGQLDFSAFFGGEYATIEGSEPSYNFGIIDWVIVGGESGHGARPCRLEWIRSIRDQCKEADVPCFIKQLGSRPECGHEGGLNQSKISKILGSKAQCMRCWFAYPKDDKGGYWDEWPADLRVREYPEAVA